MNAIGWVQGLQGLTLIVIVSGLLFVEELGVPLPFAPGDLLLAIAGIAIASGQVNPVLAVALVYSAIAAGAIIGRELFSLLGWERLIRVARPLSAHGALERAAELMRRSGWRAVFTARLIPGLRVHTTQVAGVSHMSRRHFVTGLLPAAAVYVAAFVGLGAAFGRPILQLIHETENQLVTLVLALAVPVVLALLLRAPARRTLASVGGWNGVFRFRLSSPGIFLVVACIGLNVAGHAVAVELKLPLFLDSTGTVLAALLGGPWVGGSVGVVSSLISANTIDANAAAYLLVAFAIGFASGLTRRGGGGWPAVWIVCFLVSSALSTPLNLLLSDGRSGVPLGDAIFADLTARHVPTVLATYVGEAAIDLPDKLLAAVAAYLLYRALPPQPERSRSVLLDVGDAFTWVFRSPGWPGRLLIAVLCVLLGWLLLPFLLFMGYVVEMTRRVREGRFELPDWRPVRPLLAEGSAITVVFVAWYAPGFALGVVADVAAGGSALLTASGSLLGIVALLAQPAVWAEFLARGLRGGLDVAAVARRVRGYPGLTTVVGVLGLALLAFAVGGLVAFAVGAALTVPYACCVAAHLFGQYSAATGERVQTMA
jgi:energy-coupling factor transport system substrate-specific component